MASRAVFEFDERADFVTAEGKAFTQGSFAFVELSQFAGDFFDASLALFNLTRRGALPDKPAAIHLRVEMAVGKVAADETFAGDGGAMIAELFDGVTFGVVAEE